MGSAAKGVVPGLKAPAPEQCRGDCGFGRRSAHDHLVEGRDQDRVDTRDRGQLVEEPFGDVGDATPFGTVHEHPVWRPDPGVSEQMGGPRCDDGGPQPVDRRIHADDRVETGVAYRLWCTHQVNVRVAWRIAPGATMN